MFFCEKKKTSKRFNGRIFSGIAYNGSLAKDGKLIITLEFYEGPSENIIY